MQITADAPLVEASTSSIAANPRQIPLQRAVELPSDWLRVS
jgi:hypothetical protein